MDEITLQSSSVTRALFAALNPLFRYALTRGLLNDNPCTGLQRPRPSAARDRVLTDEELALVWRGAGQLGFPFEPIIRLLVLTGQRREEVGAMSWRELDLDKAIWTIPASRAKNGKAHQVDLAPSALSIFKAIPRFSDLVFSTTGTTPPSGYSAAKRRLDKLIAADAPTELVIPPWRLHDLRRTAATGMAALGHAPHVIERVLNHVSGAQGGLVGVYQHHQYRDARKAALLAWAEHVDALIEAGT